jgi:hypothetical protein
MVKDMFVSPWSGPELDRCQPMGRFNARHPFDCNPTLRHVTQAFFVETQGIVRRAGLRRVAG